jgi:hypothetical protein
VVRITADGEAVSLWRRQVHDGPVTTIHLDTEERLITGGPDRSVCVTSLERTDSGMTAAPSRRLSLTLRCKNVRFDGVRTELEQAKLRTYSSQPSSLDRM